MQRISAHLPAAIKHLRWAYLSLIAVLSGLFSTLPAHAAVLPAAGDLHSSRDGSAVSEAIRSAVQTARRTTSAALPTHRVRAGESLSAVAVTACHGHADYWTGIYAASRSRHMTAYNANTLEIGQLLAIRCVYLPQELKFAADPPRHFHATVASFTAHRVSHDGRIWGVTYGYPNYCGDGDGDGYDVPCSQLHRHSYGTARRAVTVYSGSRSGGYSGSGSFESCVIARESGGNSQVMNASGHYGLYQFSEQTWTAHGGSAGSFGHASASEQQRVFYNTVAADGHSDWSPYDGC
jgi:Transglycosylase-like domain